MPSKRSMINRGNMFLLHYTQGGDHYCDVVCHSDDPEVVYSSLRRNLFLYNPSPRQFTLLMLGVMGVNYNDQDQQQIVELLVEREMLTITPLKSLPGYAKYFEDSKEKTNESVIRY